MSTIKTDHAKHIGPGLWYLPSVFSEELFHELKKFYREDISDWEVSYPNRINRKYNGGRFDRLTEIAYEVCPEIARFVNMQLAPQSQEVFVDLPGHKLSWHFDNNNFKILLQIYMGDASIPNAGTHWYLGERNAELWKQYGADSIVDVSGLEIVETKYAPNAGYINDNTEAFKKAHGTNRVISGTIRESILFTFG